MGLTIKTRYASGRPRTPVPNPLSVGLAECGYLWGDRLTGISVMDVDRHLGWVDAELAATVIVQARLGANDTAALIRAVGRDRHRRLAPTFVNSTERTIHAATPPFSRRRLVCPECSFPPPRPL
jgi:hypothetical protein